MMKKTFLLLVLCLSLTLAACGEGQKALPPETLAPIGTAPPSQVVSPQIENPSPSAVPNPSPKVQSPSTNVAFFLIVEKPLDEAVVDTPQVEVAGKASPGAVLTINDDILLIDPTGEWKLTVSLEEGPNLIEIVASDIVGNETSQFVTVYYEP